jgi:hypothetical protein
MKTSGIVYADANGTMETPSQLQQAGAAPMSAAQAYAQAVQQNMQARAAILQYGVKRTQLVYANSFTPATQNIVNVQPQNVGLITGFIVEVNGNVQTTGNTTLTRTEYGIANALQNITFSDLSNYIRHNTTGWHMQRINSAKQGFEWGGAYQPNVPMDLSAFNTSFTNTDAVVPNWNVRSAPLTIVNGNANVREIYYVPLAYNSSDLRGAIYGAVTNATMNLQLTIPANPTVASGGDPLNAMYVSGAAAGSWNGQVSIKVYQVYYDQLPTVTQNGQTTVALPLMDLNNQYCLLQTSLTGLLSGQDFPYPFANFRNFMSILAVVDNAGVFAAGTEINYVALTSANNTNIFKYSPEIAALFSRAVFMSDPPLGEYYFDFRGQPINTNQFGNMNLNFNPNGNISAGASLQVGAEYFAQQTQVSGAQSLAAS